MVRSAQNGIVTVHRWLLNAGNPVDASLLAVPMDMGHQCRDIREGRCVWNGASIGVKAAVPTGVDVDVLKAMVLETGEMQCIGLSLDIRLGQKAAVDGLFAVTAPAEVRPLTFAIDLSLGRKDGQHTNGKEGCCEEVDCFHVGPLEREYLTSEPTPTYVYEHDLSN